MMTSEGSGMEAATGNTSGPAAQNGLHENIVRLRTEKSRPLTILAVEDDRLERMFLERQVKAMGHSVMQAADGDEAIEILRRKTDAVDVILMDKMMPRMDGLTAVRKIKEDPDLRKIPIIMLTGADSKEEMQKGIEAGVFYYLTKPADEEVLRSVLLAATREADKNRTLSDELKKHRASFNLIQTCKFNFRTLSEAECLSLFMAHCFPEPERVLRGIAELMINAVEHGNLEIGYERKTALVESGSWRDEILRRQDSEKYRDRTAEAVITRKDTGIYVIVTDEGAGFPWRRYMAIDPARAGDNHGRGIAQARAMSFDKLTYNEKGNQAVAFVSVQPRLEW